MTLPAFNNETATLVLNTITQDTDRKEIKTPTPHTVALIQVPLDGNERILENAQVTVENTLRFFVQTTLSPQVDSDTLTYKNKTYILREIKNWGDFLEVIGIEE